MSSAERSSDEIAKALQRALCISGIPLQYAALHAGATAFENRSSRWVFSVSEYPVAVGTNETRADFILQSPDSQVFLVCECKRSLAAMSDWIFLRSPYIARGYTEDTFISDRVTLGRHGSAYRVDACTGASLPDNSGHIAMALKTGDQGRTNDGGGPREDIDKVAGQVCRAANGLIQGFRHHTGYDTDRQITVVPLIVTTANLFTSSVDLKDASITDGGISVDSATIKEELWVFWQYPTSPSIKHTYSPAPTTANPARLLRSLYLRTIPVINAACLARFLAQYEPAWFDRAEPMQSGTSLFTFANEL